MPAVEEGTSDPASLGHAYQILARILANRLDWYKALEGETLAPPPAPIPHTLDQGWLARHRGAALEGLAAAEMPGFMEISHSVRDSVIEKSQGELLAAARQAQVRGSGWPIGIVLDHSRNVRPKATNDGIVVNFAASGLGRTFDYWTLNTSGDFLALTSLNEDAEERGSRPVLFFDTRIARATEAVMHCANLYKALGVDPNAHIDMVVRYGGLRGRILQSSSPRRLLFEAKENTAEDEVSVALVVRLGAIESLLVETVKKLCKPLFVVFEFESFTEQVYQGIVSEFVGRRIS